MLGLSRVLHIRQGFRTPVQAIRSYSIRRPINTGILFVAEKEAWLIERFGKYHRTLQAGLNFCIPFIDRIAYVQSLKEVAIDIPDQPAITADNVVLHLNGVLFLKVKNPYLASYGVSEAEYAITQLAQTTMRSELGKITLDNVFKEREALNLHIVSVLGKAADPWGIECLRYEIRDVSLPPKIKEAMQLQVEADRRKRASILESEGQRESAINKAEGIKRSQVLASEGQKQETMNKAYGEAEAVIRLAESRAQAIKLISDAIANKHGNDAIQLSVAEKYIEAFQNLAKQTNTVLLPSNVGDISSMVAQALAIFKSVNTGVVNDSASSQSSQPPLLSSDSTTSSKSSSSSPSTSTTFTKPDRR